MKFRMLLLSMLISVACNKKEKDKEDSPVITDGPPSGLTTAELIGGWSVCRDATGSGNDLPDPSSYLNILNVNANETYTFSQMYFTGTSTCQGGSNVFSYTQWGTISQEGSATSPAGSTNFKFTSTETLITFYNATIKSHFVASCPTFTINHGTDSARNASTPPCNVGSDVFFDGFTGAVNSTYNVFSLNTATTPYTLSTGGNFDWQPGMGGYPTSMTLNYKKN